MLSCRRAQAWISILTSAEAFEEARRSECRAYDAVAKVASIVAHEEWHVRHGGDERGAYEAQLATLVRLGRAVRYGPPTTDRTFR